MKTIVMPLPAEGFDPTESSVPWHYLVNEGYEVIFATPNGQAASVDRIMIDGKGLGLLKPVLAAHSEVREAFKAMSASPSFKAPLPYAALAQTDAFGLLLPGGHAKGMKTYLESKELQTFAVRHVEASKPWGAICHGVVLAARARKADGRSILYGRKTTCLLKTQELLAWNMTRIWMNDYYRTYPQTVEDEVRDALKNPGDFIKGPLPLMRDDAMHPERGFTVVDGAYVSARWPGDCHAFSRAFIEVLKRKTQV